MDREAATGSRLAGLAATAAQRRLDGAFDLFLCHNSKDKPAVREFARDLQDLGLLGWIDEEQLLPGDEVLETLQRVIEAAGSIAVCIGPNGLGRWQTVEYPRRLRAVHQRWRPQPPGRDLPFRPGAAREPGAAARIAKETDPAVSAAAPARRPAPVSGKKATPGDAETRRRGPWGCRRWEETVASMMLGGDQTNSTWASTLASPSRFSRMQYSLGPCMVSSMRDHTAAAKCLRRMKAATVPPPMPMGLASTP